MENFEGICEDLRGILTAGGELDGIWEALAGFNYNPSAANIFSTFRGFATLADVKLVIIEDVSRCLPVFTSTRSDALDTVWGALTAAGRVQGRPPATYDWSAAGVLVVHSALTRAATTTYKPHTILWKEYISGVVRRLARPTIIFGAFDYEAQAYQHPARGNVLPDTFLRARGPLWARLAATIPITRWSCPDRRNYIFTDGAATSNGKPGCASAWAFYHVDPTGRTYESAGITELDAANTTSNNRAELTGILRALEYIEADSEAKYVLISDSQYSINCIETWYAGWVKSPDKLVGKKNLDLISRAHKLYSALAVRVEFRHMRSHKEEPEGHTSDWFYWHGNDRADRLCTGKLAESKKKTVT
jgi:ribonuclease HI